MRVLTFTNLYPSAARPRHGIFIEHRVRQLAMTGSVSTRVIAPVPWVPRNQRWLGQYSQLANVPASEQRHGIAVRHPRYLAIPKVTSWLNPFSMAACALPVARALQRESDFDVIDAHFFYPDGAAAVLLASWLGKPVVVTARGTDVNIFPRYRVPRAWIKWVARHASASITVSAALRARLMELGVPPDRVSVMRNGVDLELFTATGHAAARSELKLTAPTLLSVGHLIADKGHQLVIEALTGLPQANLIVIGDGPMRAELLALATRLGVASRVRWVGTIAQPELAKYYLAADVTVLASTSEGMANVLLESLACGTPVIATDVGGNAEVVSSAAVGALLKERTAAAIVDAFGKLDLSDSGRERARAHAQQFGWGPTVQGLLDLFESVCSRGGTGVSHAAARAPSN